MLSIERLRSLLERLASYSPWEVAFELIVIWVVVYMVVRFVQGTRAAGALKGLFVIVLLITIASRFFGSSRTFQRLGVLHEQFLALVAVALIVIFQPELRRALVRLGEAPFFRSNPKDVALIVDQIVDASRYLSKAKFGAILAIERQVGLRGIVEGGTVLNAELSARLLQTIFHPGSALHDLGVLIKGRSVHAAGVQFPLADPGDMPDATLGSRHRAAVGLSRECDALVIVISEETGGIRVAERGRLTHPLSPDELRAELKQRLGKTLATARKASVATPAGPDPAGESLAGAGHDTIAGMGAIPDEARER